jgi:hypothetical protein
MVEELRGLFRRAGSPGEIELYPGVHHGFACRRKIEMSPGAQSRDDTPVGDGAEERAGLHLAVRLSSAFDCRAGSGLRYYCR